jgi:hypothetical protein
MFSASMPNDLRASLLFTVCWDCAEAHISMQQHETVTRKGIFKVFAPVAIESSGKF